MAETATTAGSEVRADLSDMCTLQLGMLYQLLSRAGGSYSSMRCAVYARSFTEVGPGQVKLARVAQFPVVPGSDEDIRGQQQNTLLLHTEQSWALQGGSAAVDPSAMIDDCLLHREVVALPSSSALVFPLVDCSVLVGLLVVELEPEQQHGTDPLAAAVGSAGAAGPAEVPALPGAASSVAALLPSLCSGEGAAAGWEARAGAGARAGSTGGGGDGERALEGWMGHGGSGHAHGRVRRNLTDEELRCLRLAVPLLSKACGMDARASLQLAQSSVAASAARGLVREAQRPLSTLNTLSTMLVPRLKEGDPDKDLAKGVLMQGKRLQDVLWQLEEALHGHGTLGPAFPAAPGGLPHAMALPLSPDGRGLPPAVATTASPPFRSPSALPRDPSPAIQELLQLPQPRPAALPPSSQEHPAGALSGPASAADAAGPARGSGTGAAEATHPEGCAPGPQGVSSRGSGGGPAPVLPGRVTFVDRSAENGPSVAGASLGAFTIRQPQGFSGGLGGGRAPPAGAARPGAAMATIDVEMESCDTREPTRSAEPGALALRSTAGVSAAASTSGRGSGGGAALGWSQAQLHGAGGALAAAISTNLVSALAGVLVAAYKLAAVSGIGFIVNSPLSSVLPRRAAAPGGAAAASGGAAAAGGSGKARTGGDGAAAAAPKSADVSGPRLIPRPSRPLLVGVRAALAQKLVGYMLDIALQCTPRGGQVCVSARQDGAGVQVQVLHSGRMDLQRLHARSRAMMPAALAAGAAAAAAAAPAALARGESSRHGGGGGAAVAVAARPAAAAVLGGGGGGAAPQLGSGVLSVEMAQELAQQAGGHLTVSYPFNMVNARSGVLDVGTSVEIWLPGPGAA